MSLSNEERVLSRARSLMANRGLGWSKALEIAAESVGTPVLTNFPTRAQIDAAEPLEFVPAPRAPEQEATIQIHVSPAGVTVVMEYIGPVSSVHAALDRLRRAGVMELVSPAAPAPITTKPHKAHRERVEPIYLNDVPCCPAHRKPLVEGQQGLYCTARAEAGEERNSAGRCALRFPEY